VQSGRDPGRATQFAPQLQALRVQRRGPVLVTSESSEVPYNVECAGDPVLQSVSAELRQALLEYHAGLGVVTAVVSDQPEVRHQRQAPRHVRSQLVRRQALLEEH